MTAEDLAHIVTHYLNQKGDSVSPKKLQKLLYYIEAWHLVHIGVPLIDEEFQAWVHGPVLPSLYHQLKEFGFNDLKVVAEEFARTPEPENAEAAVPAEPEASAQEAAAPPAAAPPAAEPQPITLTHWRWVGLPKPRPPEQRQPRAKPQHQKSQTTGKPQAKPERAPVAAKQTAQPSSLALQLAALKGLKL